MTRDTRSRQEKKELQLTYDYDHNAKMIGPNANCFGRCTVFVFLFILSFAATETFAKEKSHSTIEKALTEGNAIKPKAIRHSPESYTLDKISKFNHIFRTVYDSNFSTRALIESKSLPKHGELCLKQHDTLEAAASFLISAEEYGYDDKHSSEIACLKRLILCFEEMDTIDRDAVLDQSAALSYEQRADRRFPSRLMALALSTNKHIGKWANLDENSKYEITESILDHFIYKNDKSQTSEYLALIVEVQKNFENQQFSSELMAILNCEYDLQPDTNDIQVLERMMNLARAQVPGSPRAKIAARAIMRFARGKRPYGPSKADVFSVVYQIDPDELGADTVPKYANLLTDSGRSAEAKEAFQNVIKKLEKQIVTLSEKKEHGSAEHYRKERRQKLKGDLRLLKSRYSTWLKKQNEKDNNSD